MFHTDFKHRLHLNKPHHQTSTAFSCLPFILLYLIFHFHFISLSHILNLEPEFGSKQTSIRFHQTLTWITYSYIYTVELLIDTQFEYQLGLAKSLSDCKSKLSLSKSMASTPLDYLYSPSKCLLSTDSTLQSNLRALSYHCLFSISLTNQCKIVMFMCIAYLVYYHHNLCYFHHHCQR